MVFIKTACPKFKNISQIMRFLKEFTNYEQNASFKYSPRKFNLKNMNRIMKELGNPHTKFKSIHVAGTKGKGSTCFFISRMLQARDLKVGLYLSPHLIRLNERIQIQCAPIENKSLVNALNEIAPFAICIKESNPNNPPTFFEIMTSAAFFYFAEEKVDLAVVEVGLGGRLDSTNILKPEISVICPVDYDHTDQLGKKLSDIAYEKAGIIKLQTPCVVGKQRPSALRVLKNVARQNKSQLFILGRDFHTKNISSTCNKDVSLTRFDFNNNEISLKNVQINALGNFQAENAASALQVIYLLSKSGKVKFDLHSAIESLRNFQNPCRLQRLLKNPDFFIDCAHNEISVSEISKTIKSLFPQKKIVVIFGIAQDKAVKNILSILNKYFETIIFTHYKSPRSTLPEKLADLFSTFSKSKKEIFTAKNSKEATQKALSLVREEDLILCFGSIYLAGEVYKTLL